VSAATSWRIRLTPNMSCWLPALTSCGAGISDHRRSSALGLSPDKVCLRLRHWTKLPGPAKWTYFYLYVILDVFSRYVVGWMVANGESAELAKQLIAETCTKQNIQRDELTIHADRGSSVTSKAVAFLLADMGITKTHSRPHVLTSGEAEY
jgi:transposase InsO family protein